MPPSQRRADMAAIGEIPHCQAPVEVFATCWTTPDR